MSHALTDERFWDEYWSEIRFGIPRIMWRFNHRTFSDMLIAIYRTPDPS